eukprot:jgi/Chrzof1/814/Cz01g29230.t1
MRCMSCLSARLLANHAAATADLSCGLHVLLQDISGGEVILRVPLALAITDYMEDAQREALPGRGDRWQDRLVSNFLREVVKGHESPWYPYIQALPSDVPCALESFSADDIAAVEDPVAMDKLDWHCSCDLRKIEWEACDPDSISHASLEQYRWAHKATNRSHVTRICHLGVLDIGCSCSCSCRF